MPSELVPIRLGVTAGDRYTLWAPRWRDGGDEWEAFLGKGEQVYAFESVADLAAFVRTDTSNDLAEHPAWARLAESNAHRLEPKEERYADLVGVAELLGEKPSETSVGALAYTLAVVNSIGSACELPTVTRFFNGNPNLGWVSGGLEEFTGRAGRKRWDALGEIVLRGWDAVITAIDEVLATPPVDETVSAQAAAELAEPWEAPEEEETGEDGEFLADSDGEAGDDLAEAGAVVPAAARTVVLGSDKNFWENVGIDPVRVMIGGGTFYTLRCYYGDKPVFLGRNGRVSVFPSERTLARYLADEHDHDLADMSTYEDIRTAATDGSLRVEVQPDNVYVLTGLADDIADGPEALDRDQLTLALEFIEDVGVYSEDDTVSRILAGDTALSRVVDYVLSPGEYDPPAGPHAAAVKDWETLERFVESRLRRE